MIIIATPEMGKIGHQGLNSRIKIGTTKEFPTKSDAYKAELFIKSQKSRSYIENLI